MASKRGGAARDSTTPAAAAPPIAPHASPPPAPLNVAALLQTSQAAKKRRMQNQPNGLKLTLAKSTTPYPDGKVDTCKGTAGAKLVVRFPQVENTEALKARSQSLEQAVNTKNINPHPKGYVPTFSGKKLTAEQKEGQVANVDELYGYEFDVTNQKNLFDVIGALTEFHNISEPAKAKTDLRAWVTEVYAPYVQMDTAVTLIEAHPTHHLKLQVNPEATFDAFVFMIEDPNRRSLDRFEHMVCARAGLAPLPSPF